MAVNAATGPAMRLLLVEDDTALADSLTAAFGHAGYAVDACRSAAEATSAFVPDLHGLVVLDLGLPDRSGLELLREWRRQRIATPVLVLTARDTVADDYLVKPFDLDELLARARALSRRVRGQASERIVVGALELDTAQHVACWRGERLTLTPHQFVVLAELAANAGRLVPRARLEAQLHAWGEEAGSNVLDVHVHHLRRKTAREFIRTVRGLGFTIDD